MQPAPEGLEIAVTPRVALRRLCMADAPFLLRLLNEPSWLQFIGDKAVHTLEDARNYLVNGPLAMYARDGFGLYLVERLPDRVPMGMCGLIRRETLPEVDVGFAFFPEHWGQGYAREAVLAVLDYGQRVFGLRRVIAVTSPGNERSIKLLEGIGFRFEGLVQMTPGEAEIKMFGRPAPPD
jgi:ribosomal-protein-alanine N-acetyltransferase